MKAFAYVALLILGFQIPPVLAQGNETLPISTQTLLGNVKSAQSKDVIKSVLMIICPKDQKKGTGFVLAGGKVIATNSHVVGTCGAEELVGTSSVSTEPIRFTAKQTDDNRDLAILCASKPLPSSLKLDGDENAEIETEVETWGYPLSYQAPAPLLSRGYVAGYSTAGAPGSATQVKHLIINGAFNPGNSGGPLIDRNTGKVIGVVVTKWTLWSPQIEIAIQGFSKPGIATYGSFGRTDEHGQEVRVSDQEVLASVLAEFYQTSQVMIGEAISVSEVKAFLKEKQKDLACSSHSTPEKN